MLELNLRIAGLIILGLTVIYPIYPRRFGWREQLAQVSLLVRNIFVVHLGFIVLLLGLQGILLAFFPKVLLESSSAAIALLIGLVAFWLYRLFAQLFLFDRRNWQGDRLNTLVHAIFTLLWIYLTAVPAWALWQQLEV